MQHVNKTQQRLKLNHKSGENPEVFFAKGSDKGAVG